MNYIKMPVVLIALFAAALMTGCFKDNGGEQPAGGGPKDGLTINLSVPGMAAMTRSEYENRIEDLDVIVFGLDGKFVESYVATEINSNNTLTAFQYYIPELELTGDFEIVAVANYPAVVAAALTKARAESGENFTKEQFVQYLEFRAKENNLPYWAAYPWYTPMYGETRWEGGFSPTTQAVSVELTRAVAFIEVRMLDSYPLEWTSFRDLSYNGMLRPNYENPFEPNLPLSPQTTPGSFNGAGPHSIYIMEAPARDDDSDGFHILIRLNYGILENNYYRIDMAWDGSIAGTVRGEPMPILRNYKYYVNIHKVLGPGYSSQEEARLSDSQLNNLEYTIHVEDSGRFGMVAYDGSYMLGVEETSFDVSADEQIIPIKVSSNHPNFWSVKSDASWMWVSVVYNLNQTIWLYDVSSHSALSSLAIKVDKNTGGVERTGKVTVTSGRLSIPITVKQSIQSAVSIEIIGAPYVSADTYSLKWEDGTHEKKGVLIKWKPADAELKVNKTADQNGGFLYGDDSDLIENDTSLRGGSAFFNICPSENHSVAYGSYITRYTLSVANMGNPVFLDLAYVVYPNCGTDGVAVSQRIGNNDYLTHMYGGYCWMVENSKEGNAIATYYGQGGTIGSTDLGVGNTQHYYTLENASTACPPGWHLPKYNEHSSLVNAVTTGNGNSPKEDPAAGAKWWCGPNADASTAFAGYFYFSQTIWYCWGEHGYWWYGTGGDSFEGHAGGMTATYDPNNLRWYSVRCVHDYL